jgi:hypothetical protein
VLFFGPAQGTLKRLVAGRFARRVVRALLIHGGSPFTVATWQAPSSLHVAATAGR